MKFTKAMAVVTTAGLLMGAGATAASANSYAPKVDSGSASFKKTKSTLKKTASIKVAQKSVKGLSTKVVASHSALSKSVTGTVKNGQSTFTLTFKRAGVHKVKFVVTSSVKGQPSSAKTFYKTVTVGKKSSVSKVTSKRSGKTVTISGKATKNSKVVVSYKIGKKSYKKTVKVSSKGVYKTSIDGLKKKSKVTVTPVTDKSFYKGTVKSTKSK